AIENIQGGVDIPISGEPAVRTNMYANMQVFWYDHPALTAFLRGVAWVYGNHLNPGLKSLVAEDVVEDAQRHIVGGTGEIAIAQHEGDVQVFQHHRAVGVDQPVNNLVPPVAALVGDVFEFFCQLAYR